MTTNSKRQTALNAERQAGFSLALANLRERANRNANKIASDRNPTDDAMFAAFLSGWHYAR